MLYVNEVQITITNELSKRYLLEEVKKVFKIMKLIYISLNYDLRIKSYKLIQIKINILEKLIKVFENIFIILVDLRSIKKLFKCGFDSDEPKETFLVRSIINMLNMLKC